MAVILKNGKKKIKKYLDYENDDSKSIKEKKTTIKNLKFNVALLSLPKDKESLVKLVGDYIANFDAWMKKTVSDKENAALDNLISAKKKAKLKNQSDAPFEIPSDNGDNISSESKVEEIEIAYPEESSYIELPNSIHNFAYCSDKALRVIAVVLNKRQKLIKRIGQMKRDKATIEDVESIIGGVKTYNSVLEKVLPILTKYDVVSDMNSKVAKKLYDDVSMNSQNGGNDSNEESDFDESSTVEKGIKKNKEDQDFDIISALSYCGVSVEQDDNGKYSVVKANNGNGIKYYVGKSEKSFALSKRSCAKFVDEFLNKPIEERKYMTPGQVFILYIHEAEDSLGINNKTDNELVGIFGSLSGNKSTKQYFRNIIEKYSRNSADWKNYQKVFEAGYYTKVNESDNQNSAIRQQAKKLVISELFEDIINDGNVLTKEQIAYSDYRVSDISKDFGINTDFDSNVVSKKQIEKLEDQSFRTISTMHSAIQDLRLLSQDVIDDYSTDYLRKEKIFSIQEDNQSELVNSKKEFEDLLKDIDGSTNNSSKADYYRQQIDDLSQKIGSSEYIQAKEDFATSKNNYRMLIVNVKSQKDLVKNNISSAKEKNNNKNLTTNEIVDIIRTTLIDSPELDVALDKNRVTSWSKDKEGNKIDRKQQSLVEIDEIVNESVGRISEESKQRVLEENKMRDKINKSQKPKRTNVKNNAVEIDPDEYLKQIQQIRSSKQVAVKKPIEDDYNEDFENKTNTQKISASQLQQIRNSKKVADKKPIEDDYIDELEDETDTQEIPTPQPTPRRNNVQQNNGYMNLNPNYEPAYMGGGMFVPSNIPMMNMNYSNNYQALDMINENVEPNIIPYIVSYTEENKNVYGNKLERYSIMDRYKYLLTTNNNALYKYVDSMKTYSSEQIIGNLRLRYLKNALSHNNVNISDESLVNFDGSDVKSCIGESVKGNKIDGICRDYEDAISSIDLDLLKDLVEHQLQGDLETFIPDYIQSDMIECANMISSVAKVVMADKMVKKTFEAYSSKMKQTYIASVIDKIKSGELPLVQLENEEIYSRMIDYISFSIRAQNVIANNNYVQNSGFGLYPRAIYLKQKSNTDNMINSGKTLSYEQNELFVGRNEPNLSNKDDVAGDLFGSLYKFNSDYKKLLVKIKPHSIKGGIEFVEYLIDSLNQEVDIATIEEIENKTNDEDSLLSMFVDASTKQSTKDEEDSSGVTNSDNVDSLQQVADEQQSFGFNYEDDVWFVRKGFVLDKNKVKEYFYNFAFGMKYALQKNKTNLKNDFYDNDMLKLNKINDKFKDLDSTDISLITSSIRNIMMTKFERFIDFVDYINKQNAMQFNKMIYISNALLQSNNFELNGDQFKLNSLSSLDKEFNGKVDDSSNPHPEIYASIDDCSRYKRLYEYYALTKIFEIYAKDDRFITDNLVSYFDNLKLKFRTDLLSMIREGVALNGYEEDLARYFELNLENANFIECKDVNSIQENIDNENNGIDSAGNNISLLDVIYKGVFEGYSKAFQSCNDQLLRDELQNTSTILEFIGTIVDDDESAKDIEVALPNNKTMKCNLRGFIQQYLLQIMVNKGGQTPFDNALKLLENNKDLSDIASGIRDVSNRLTSSHLGINLFAKFSSIEDVNGVSTFKFGERLSTTIENINKLQTNEDSIEAINNDMFYQEGVDGVKDLFVGYFNELILSRY